MDARATAAVVDAVSTDVQQPAPRSQFSSTGRLNDYLSKLDHRVSLIVVEGGSSTTGGAAKSAAATTSPAPTSSPIPELRTPTHERGRASLAQRIQQLIAEEEGGKAPPPPPQQQQQGQGAAEGRDASVGGGSLICLQFDIGEEDEMEAAAAVDAGGGDLGARRASFLPPRSGRPSLTSLLFPSLDNSAGGGGSEAKEEAKEGQRDGAVSAALADTGPSPVGADPVVVLGEEGGPQQPQQPQQEGARGGEEQPHPQPQQQRKEKEAVAGRWGTTMAAGTGAGAAGVVVWKGELASVKSALRQDLEELHNMVLDVGKRVKEIETDIKQRGKLQAAKDSAQDELVEMELKQLSRQIEAKLSRTEIVDITQLQTQKLKAVESSVLGLMDERAQRLQHKLHDELEKVLQQLYNIQQASDKTRRVVDDRVKQSATEQAAVQRELMKERRDKEELAGQVKRLGELLLQSEGKQAEESLKQREAVHGMEERWGQQLAREAADARREVKALGEAVGEDLGTSIATGRKEREELKAELLAALRDLDARLATCREELTRQAAVAAAAQERSLESLNAFLTSAMESRVAGVKAELLARIEALSQQQQASEAKTSVALQRQAERAGALHEEALACVDAARREAVERLRERLCGVEAALQESNMQLSQRLSGAVQRLALCEVRGVEKHDLLKALLKEVATTLLKAEAAAGLEEHASVQEIIKRLEAQRDADVAAAARVDHLVVGLAESCKQMRGTVQALASRDNHGAVLETRLAEHCRGLVDQCVTVHLSTPTGPTPRTTTTFPPAGPRVVLRRDTRDFIATSSYRIAKTIAAKADYEVIRLLVGRKEAMGDEECDATVLRLRETYLHHFMQALAAGVEKKHPTAPSPLALTEARQHFYAKVEQAIRLALSKFARVHVGRSLLGRIGLSGASDAPPPPACACCNRPFPHSGSTATAAPAAAACVFSPARTQAATPRGAASAMRPTVSSALRPALSLELDGSASNTNINTNNSRSSNSNKTTRNGCGGGKPAVTRPLGLSRQATYSAVDEILRDYNPSGGRAVSGGRAARRGVRG